MIGPGPLGLTDKETERGFIFGYRVLHMFPHSVTLKVGKVPVAGGVGWSGGDLAI